MNFQNIQPKRVGLRCEVQVINFQGHGVLTTYDVDVDNSVEIAQSDLVDFFDKCIKEYGRNPLPPIVNGNLSGRNVLIDVKAPEFDLSLYTNVTIMPCPLAGG